VNLTDVAVSGPLLLALTAGAVSFDSPCCLPLVPGYLAYLAGLVGATPPPVTLADGAARRVSGRWRVAGAAALFVLGFTVVFASTTMAVLGLSDAMLVNEQLLQRLGGVITIVMGLVFLGAFPVLQRGMRPRHTPATACGALRCAAPSTAWAGRRV
jgi:cytochrome c-type biogenesis protein